LLRPWGERERVPARELRHLAATPRRFQTMKSSFQSAFVPKTPELVGVNWPTPDRAAVGARRHRAARTTVSLACWPSLRREEAPTVVAGLELSPSDNSPGMWPVPFGPGSVVLRVPFAAAKPTLLYCRAACAELSNTNPGMRQICGYCAAGGCRPAAIPK